MNPFFRCNNTGTSSFNLLSSLIYRPVCMHRFVLSILLLFLLASASLAVAQDPCEGTTSKKAKKCYNEAMEALRDRKSSVAINHLVEALEYDEEYGDALWRLGQLYYNKKRGQEAETFLKQLLAQCPTYNTEAYYMLGSIYFGREEYSKAVPYLEEFLKDVEKIKSDRDYDDASYLLDQAKFLADILQQKVPFEPYKVMDISTEEDEYLVIISPDGELAFFTRRTKDIPLSGSISWSDKYREQFMIATKVNGKFDKGDMMPSPFNLTGNEGGATVTARNDELYFTICSNIKVNDVVYNNCDLYYSRLFYDQWNPLEKLGNDICGDSTWESQPSVSSDGKTLFFASDRPGGYGGSDLYVVRKDSDNQWGKPQNLGPAINTPGNEKTPFIHTDSQTLYFSSSDRADEFDSLYFGHRGLGGYDIFFTRNKDGKWSKPLNLGYPINSQSDDLGFFVSTDGATGYFSSNKIEGSGGYDLYAFNLYPEARPQKVLFIKGNIKDENDIPMTDSKIELRNVVTNEVKEVEVDSFSGKYVATAIFDYDFVLTVKKPEHIYQSRYIARDSAVFAAPSEIDFEIEKVETGKSYQLHDIYFATNSADLSKNSLFILNEFVEFLNDNGRIRVDIQGHTDDIGDDTFNQELSRRRSKSVYDYLITKGISAQRLSFQGFGESKPVADNTTEEGRAKNRRTEFVISGK